MLFNVLPLLIADRGNLSTDEAVPTATLAGLFATVSTLAGLSLPGALLYKSANSQSSPFPENIYPAATVTEIPRAVKRFMTAARIWTSAT